MSTYAKNSLLPEGLHDELPPAAEQRSAVIATLLGVFAGHGYDQVAPPLIEFEDSLLSGSGAAQGRHMFRLMDPLSHRMMALRADITLQVARIAATRLANSPRPLRLCYAGPVLRVKGRQFHPERELSQAGFELIGAPDPASRRAADIEVLLVAATALRELGVEGLSADLTLPPLVPALCRAFGVDDGDFGVTRSALDSKDKGALAGLPAAPAAVFEALIDATGPALEGLEKIATLDLPTEARRLCDGLHALLREVHAAMPELALTVDVGDSRGFEYYTGAGFALFAPGARGALGRGGRYQAAGKGSETATGFTVYVDALLRALPPPKPGRRLHVPHEVPWHQVQGLAADGWRVVRGLIPEADNILEARRLDCGHVYESGGIQPVEGPVNKGKDEEK